MSSSLQSQHLPQHNMSIPLHRDGRMVTLNARLCTPAGTENPTAIDPAYPTILFCHPIWLDSFFFYPQMEDPLFADHYNLVAFDMRGHGLTTVDGSPDDQYDAWTAAQDLAAGLEFLGVTRTHVLGTAFGASVAARLASLHPALVETLILISLPPPQDSPEMAAGYAECQEALIAATKTGDVDCLDAITTATFQYDASTPLSQAVREIRDEYMTLARQRFPPNGTEAATVEQAAYYIWNPVTTREALGAQEMGRITSPTLILQGCGQENDHADDAIHFAAVFNGAHHDTASVRASLRLIADGGHYMTLTSPNVVNPLIAKYIGTPSSAALPPLPADGSRIVGPAIARRPSTPREVLFDIPPIPRVIPGMRTVGDELDRLRVDVVVATEVSAT